jgi:hypothetical protein
MQSTSTGTHFSFGATVEWRKMKKDRMAAIISYTLAYSVYKNRYIVVTTAVRSKDWESQAGAFFGKKRGIIPGTIPLSVF